ncbi:MAG TPA: helix-turn-helix transcriptional regulator [Thermoanaerobaculia bacterium]|nr:helix-turn-helix transcriptional regulator [Thermoanaerobaculia bacterium]
MPANPDAERRLPLTPLAFHVLIALGAEDRHGYGIIKDIEARTDGALSLRSGTLYTALQRLLEAGWIEDAPAPASAAVDARRRYYRITSLGRAVATAESERLARLVTDACARQLAPGKSGG